MHSITCLNEKNLFIWVCLICRKEKSESKNEQKEQEGWNPGKETRCVGDIILAPSIEETLTISRSAWKMNLVVQWIEMPLSNFRLAYRFSRTFFIRFIYWLFIQLFIIWLNYLSIFSRINFSRIATLQKKIYLNENISIQAEMSSKFMKIMYKLQFSVSR